MEEERYKIDKSTNYYTNTIVDTKTNTYYGNIEEHIDLLNQQDKRIKELEETNKVLSNELTKNSILKQDHIETCCGIPIFEIPKMKAENQQLKQQLHDLPKKIVEEIENELLPEFSGSNDYEHKYYIITKRILSTILKKFGGEDE